MAMIALAVLPGCKSAAAPTSIERIETTQSKAPEKSNIDHAGHDHGDEAPRIDLADAKQAFDSGKAVFVDTRSAESFKREHIKNAVNITPADFDARYGDLPKDTKLIVYCS